MESIPDSPKLKITRTDAPFKVQLEVLKTAQECFNAINASRSNSTTGNKSSKSKNVKWDSESLQTFCNLVSSNLAGGYNCVAGGDFNSSLKYLKKSLIVLESTAVRVLIYKSMPHSAGLSLALKQFNPFEGVEEGAKTTNVKVLEHLKDNDDAEALAVKVLGLKFQVDEASTLMQTRSTRLRDALNASQGPFWHVLFDTHPLAVAPADTPNHPQGPHPNRMMLEVGKYTFIVFRHTADDASILDSFNTIPRRILRLIVLAMCAAGYLWFKTSKCPSTTDEWTKKACQLCDENMHYVLVALALIYVYFRMMNSTQAIKSQKISRLNAAARNLAAGSGKSK